MEVLTEVDGARLRPLVEARHVLLARPRQARPTTTSSALAELLGLHPAAVEDTREWGQLPRLDDYGDHVLLVFFTARIATTDRASPSRSTSTSRASWIVTVRRCATGLDRQREWLAEQRARGRGRGPLPRARRAGRRLGPGDRRGSTERVDEVEAEVLERPQQEHLRHDLPAQAGGRPSSQRRAGAAARGLLPAVETIHRLDDLTQRLARVAARRRRRTWSAIASDLRRLTGDLAALTDTFFNANANRLNRLGDAGGRRHRCSS